MECANCGCPIMGDPIESDTDFELPFCSEACSLEYDLILLHLPPSEVAGE